MKLHMCCGDIYLKNYTNCDIDGFIIGGNQAVRQEATISLADGNPNETDLAHYFKNPFQFDISKRVRRPFIIDCQMNILDRWPFDDQAVDEIVMISGFEHFEHLTELPHIIDEVHRVLRSGGIWKFDFPDLKEIVALYHDTDPEFMAEQIYCNHKNKYSVHQWGYTVKSVSKYVTPDKWNLEFKDVVRHDYPMAGVWATKK